MNWIGGVRNRVKFQKERKAQKEFFERKKFEVPQNRLKAMSTPCLKRNSVSQDLLALQTINHAHSTPKLAKTSVKRIDLEGFRSIVKGRRCREIELPTSPNETSSVLDLMEKSFYKSKYLGQNSDNLFCPSDRPPRKKDESNTKIQASLLLSPEKTTKVSAHSACSSLSENSLKYTIIPETKLPYLQKEADSCLPFTNNSEIKPFLYENAAASASTVKCRLANSDYATENLTQNSKHFLEDSPNILLKKCNASNSKKLDQRVCNMWVSEDFQSKLVNDDIEDSVDYKYFKSSCNKSFGYKPLNLTASPYKSPDKRIKLEMPFNTYFQHSRNMNKAPFVNNRRDDNYYINELTPFFRKPSPEFRFEKYQKITKCFSEGNNRQKGFFWTLSEPKIQEKHENKSKILLDSPLKLQEKHCTENVFIPLKPSPCSSITDENSCTFDQVSQTKGVEITCISADSKCSATDEVLQELIHLDDQNEDFKNLDMSEKDSFLKISDANDKNKTIMEAELHDKESGKVTENFTSGDGKPKNTTELVSSVFKAEKTEKLNTTTVLEICELSTDEKLSEGNMKPEKGNMQDDHLDNSCYKSENSSSAPSTKDSVTTLQVPTFVQTNVRKLIDVCTSPIFQTMVDVGVQWETPEYQKDLQSTVTVSIENVDCVGKANNGNFTSSEGWEEDKCLDSHSETKEYTYTLRPRKK